MTVEMFLRYFPHIAVRVTVGVCTTVQYKGQAYTFRKLSRNKFERVS